MKYNGPYYDSEGKEIKEGHEVAFNCSGGVKRGIVKSIGSVEFENKPSFYHSWYHHPPKEGIAGKCTIKIQKHGSSEMSIVKNSNGILVIG